MPFLVQDELEKSGGVYIKGSNWQPHVITDGALITGLNPASSDAAAYALLARLANNR